MKKQKLKQVAKLVSKAIRTGRKISAIGNYSSRIRDKARRNVRDQHRVACMCVDQAVYMASCADIVASVDLFDVGTAIGNRNSVDLFDVGTAIGNRNSVSTVTFFIKHEAMTFPINFKFDISDIDIRSVFVCCLDKQVDVTNRFNHITDANVYVYGDCSPEILSEIWSRAITALLVEFAGNAKHDPALSDYLLDDSEGEWDEEDEDFANDVDEEDTVAIADPELVRKLVKLAPDVIYDKVKRMSDSNSKVQLATLFMRLADKKKGILQSIATWLNHFIEDEIDVSLGIESIAQKLVNSMYVNHKPIDEDKMSDSDWNSAVLSLVTDDSGKPIQGIEDLSDLPINRLFTALRLRASKTTASDLAKILIELEDRDVVLTPLMNYAVDKEFVSHFVHDGSCAGVAQALAKMFKDIAN